LTSSTVKLSAAGSPSPRLDAELITGHALALSRTELYVHHDRTLTAAELAAVEALVERRAAREPVAYILGRWGFRSLDLAVDSRVLIPRPETEELVGLCLELLEPVATPAVLDVGTGSGAIALALATELADARVTACDLSAAALDVARANGEELGLEVEWVESNLLGAFSGRRFDLIVSNPPYIAAAQLETLEPEVRTWEPRLATTPGGEGLELLRALAETTPRSIVAGGWLALECGDGQAAAVATALATAGFAEVGVRTDFADIQRFVIGQRQ
jgi:release factor glutamine methyltransferase